MIDSKSQPNTTKKQQSVLCTSGNNAEVSTFARMKQYTTIGCASVPTFIVSGWFQTSKRPLFGACCLLANPHSNHALGMTRRRCIFNLVQKYNAGHNYLSTWKDNHLLIIIRERELGGFATTATRMFHMHIFIFTKKSFFSQWSDYSWDKSQHRAGSECMWWTSSRRNETCGLGWCWYSFW